MSIYHTDKEAFGALPNGTRVVKKNSEPDDAHTDGETGTIRGSIGAAGSADGICYGYFVEWDNLPGIPVFIVDTRIEVWKSN